MHADMHADMLANLRRNKGTPDTASDTRRISGTKSEMGMRWACEGRIH